jgi:hypothetical protein
MACIEGEKPLLSKKESLGDPKAQNLKGGAEPDERQRAVIEKKECEKARSTQILRQCRVAAKLHEGSGRQSCSFGDLIKCPFVASVKLVGYVHHSRNVEFVQI